MHPAVTRPIAATVMFADVAGSTRLYEKLGDAAALEAIAGCLRELSAAAARFKGREIKTLGDEIMVTFAAPDQALRAAIDMQVGRQSRNSQGETGLAIRIGFHHGDVLERDQDLFGDTVNVAARMAGLAKAGQILTTGQTLAILPGYARSSVRRIDTLPIKGREETLDLCEVIWHWGEGLTILDARPPAPDSAGGALLLEHAGDSARMPGGASTLTLGRDSSADIVLAHLRASRSHARVEQRRDKFVLADTSTNGTFVQVENERELLVRHEEFALRGTGTISCGASAASAGAELIRFRVE